MRILAVTAGHSDKRSAISEALRDLYGADVLPGKAYAEKMSDRVLRRLGLAERLGTHRRNLDALNRAILERADRFDLLFVVKGNLVTVDTLRTLQARPRPPRIIGWSCDDIYLPHNNSPILKAAAPLYDVFYTAKSLNIANGELARMGFRDARFLPQGFDRDVHRPRPVAQSRLSGKVIFVGYGEADRFDKMNHLASNGVDVHVWGNGWTKAMRTAAHDGLHIHGRPLIGDNYAEALSNAAISLCFLRKLNRDLHTSRTFEIPACGGFMLAERTEEHRAYFEEDREAVYFGDADELLAKVRYYLARPEERDRIAAAGRKRCLASDYSYQRLARDIVDEAAASPTSRGPQPDILAATV